MWHTGHICEKGGGGGGATKVSTPDVLSHIEALLCSVFCMSTIVFEHSSCYSTRYGVDQSSTCLCWDPVPLLCNDFLKLCDVGHLSSSTLHFRMPHRCSIGFRSGDMLGHSNTLTFDFFRKAVVCLERCF